MPGAIKRAIISLFAAIALLASAIGLPSPASAGTNAQPPPGLTADHPIIIQSPGVSIEALSGYSPARMRKAYGIDQVVATGSGKKIAIVVAYGSPTIADDLATFDSTFGLPAASLTVHAMGALGASSGWATETAMDVEWAHAIAPGASLLLVEATSASLVDLLSAIDYAVAQGANVVSMSWGAGEFPGMDLLEGHFNVAGVAFFASAGDGGAEVNWPAVSQYVVGVGGTTLTTLADGSYVSETAWGEGAGKPGSGGGTSAYLSRPSYQNGFQSAGKRGVPDVALDADPASGAQVYDSSGMGGWGQVGGTSLSAPCWAGIATLLGTTGPAWAYAKASPASYGTNFNDVTTGSNGNPAGAGYDLVTGLGSPKVAGMAAPPPSINLTGPNGGESWTVGDTHSITWMSSGISGNVKIELSRDSGATWVSPALTSTVAASAGTYAWKVAGSATTHARIRISSVANALVSSSSAADFTITGPPPPSITLTAPNGGETAEIGKSLTVTWTSASVSGMVKIELSRDSGTTWSTIVPSTANSGSKTWTVTGPATTHARVRVSSASAGVSATSAADLTILPAGITLTAPNGGETWTAASNRNIIWTSVSLAASAMVKIELSRDGGATWTTIVPSATNSGSKTWKVSGSATTHARVRVSNAASGASAASAADFTITGPPPPSITLTAPNGGETVEIGKLLSVTWTSASLSGMVKIELSRDSGATWSTIVPSTANSGSKAWTVTGPATTHARVRVSSVSAGVSAASAADFTMPAAGITLTSPVGGESWKLGSHTITWTSVSIPATATVKIELSRNGGTTWTTIVPATANSGSKAWTFTGPATANARIRISNAAAGVSITSADFALTP